MSSSGDVQTCQLINHSKGNALASSHLPLEHPFTHTPPPLLSSSLTKNIHKRTHVYTYIAFNLPVSEINAAGPLITSNTNRYGVK